MSKVTIFYYQKTPCNLPIKTYFVHESNLYTKIYKYSTIEVENIVSVLDKNFKLFNGDENPLYDEKFQKKIIKRYTHSSMSVGDIIRIDLDYYLVTDFGFSLVDIDY
ncbi:hypothetical protein QLL95_gp0545 [Cotonvirus japonicus]|uniref:Uncharacterized protein n=1 Tax=Cotonvirus japonicus TaxID=2811091 RepID=A0ABM7NTT1_9VIRU|nr:hypothetical protein QLL95_gp0545 [Cotonvirus japonicus]BCS83578.1 hypothetical protein [Cotonvirus japonicus]